jgi:hypothetical protein
VPGNVGRYWVSTKLNVHMNDEHEFKYDALKTGYPDKVVQYVDAQPEDESVYYDSVMISLRS